jgi:uncharacterized membrane protein (DUF485 family)
VKRIYLKIQANQDFEQLLKQRHLIEQHQASFDQLKHQIQAKMQDSERATLKRVQ